MSRASATAMAWDRRGRLALGAGALGLMGAALAFAVKLDAARAAASGAMCGFTIPNTEHLSMFGHCAACWGLGAGMIATAIWMAWPTSSR